MKMARRSRKPRFGGIVVEDAIRPHQDMAQGKPVRAVKTPGLHGSRKPGSRKR